VISVFGLEIWQLVLCAVVGGLLGGIYIFTRKRKADKPQ